MSVEVLDLTNYRDRNGARVPEGNYLVQVEDIEVGKSSNKGTPQWTVYLRIVGGEQDGLTLVDRLYLTEAAMFRVVGFLNGLGVKTARKRMKIELAKLVGKKARVDVADGEPYNGTIRSDVKGYQRFASARDDEGGDDLDDLVQLDAGGDEDDEPKKPKKAKKSKKAEVDDTTDDGDIDLDDLDI